MYGRGAGVPGVESPPPGIREGRCACHILPAVGDVPPDARRGGHTPATAGLTRGAFAGPQAAGTWVRRAGIDADEVRRHRDRALQTLTRVAVAEEPTQGDHTQLVARPADALRKLLPTVPQEAGHGSAVRPGAQPHRASLALGLGRAADGEVPIAVLQDRARTLCRGSIAGGLLASEPMDPATPRETGPGDTHSPRSESEHPASPVADGVKNSRRA